MKGLYVREDNFVVSCASAQQTWDWIDPQTTYMKQSPFENLTVAQLVKNFLHFMEPEGPLPCSQEPTSGPYTKPDETSSHPHSLFP
jgi:hypothetical protein